MNVGSPECIHMQKRSHEHVKDPVVHVRAKWVIETPKITQHALKSVRIFIMLKLDNKRKDWNILFLVN